MITQSSQSGDGPFLFASIVFVFSTLCELLATLLFMRVLSEDFLALVSFTELANAFISAVSATGAVVVFRWVAGTPGRRELLLGFLFALVATVLASIIHAYLAVFPSTNAVLLYVIVAVQSIVFTMFVTTGLMHRITTPI